MSMLADSEDPYQTAEIYSLIRHFAIFRYGLQYPRILLTVSEVPEHMPEDIFSFSISNKAIYRLGLICPI